VTKKITKSFNIVHFTTLCAEVGLDASSQNFGEKKVSQGEAKVLSVPVFLFSVILVVPGNLVLKF
jgi:hypothetical protein